MIVFVCCFIKIELVLFVEVCQMVNIFYGMVEDYQDVIKVVQVVILYVDIFNMKCK